ncbi:MAG: cytochrome b N-terminal domain-containing protein [Burkholderiales bacterium]
MLAPWRHLGALGFALFWMLAASGIYLYLRFDTSVGGAYDSIGELEWWFGGVLRSVHRYAADAFVVVVALHILRELLAGRFRGFRAFTWITGVPLVWLLYASGIVGYWLVWDARAQFSAQATAEWMLAAGIGAEPMARNFLGAESISDRLFSLFVFLHIGLPLALLAGMWVHVQRLGRPATVAPRALAWGLVAMLVALALAAPVSSEARWDPLAAPGALALDWFLLYLHPLMYATSPGALWAIVGGATLALALLPYVARRPQAPAAKVDPANCNGCGRCVADCPYDAVTLRDRKAFVFDERCAACGICAGACPSSTPFRSVKELVSGIDLPDFTVQALRARMQALLPAEELVFRCEHADPGEGIALRCLAMLPPSFVEYALRNGARRVKAIGCAEGECAWRTGLELSAERFAGAREPHLRRTVTHARHGDAHEFALR